ncbi:MAG: undecaprenyldiphospho-muramoylpentapeptide beta-N-acetylglucosaminyltransferase [Bdellovibrionales bacterium]|nr:undecaprenyldiphospho-muramoylpentapeptide beta-N-acetylglucosaminyltransferase [Bdellovibrionales bacterium]
MMEQPSLIVAGGGTGGHILAGIAIAEAWKKKWPEAPILFVGARGALEEKLVPRHGIPLRLLDLGSLNRVSLGRKLKTMIQLPLALILSMVILLRARPRCVIGVGGYASGPLVLMARLVGWIWGARVGILEQNAVPGFTNRVLGKFAHRILAAFPGIEKQFPGGKVTVTGNPTRSSMKPLPSSIENAEPFTIFIFGGSQGALGINTLVLDAIPYLADLKGKLRFVHQTGEKDYERVAEGHRKLGTGAVVEKFIYDMPKYYQEASIVICRAGSSSLSELAAVKRASILIPLPTAADDHQRKNAEIFSNVGASQILVQTGAKGQDLAKMIQDLYKDRAKIQAMESKVASFYRPDAASEVIAALNS